MAVTTIGFVGLGAMGMPMACNLVRAGYTVRGFDIRAASRDGFAAKGGIAAASVADALAGADLAVLMVVNITQAQDVLGDVAALAPGGVVALMATCPPGAVATLAQDVLGLGYGFLDVPVSGGVVGAEAGSLTIMAAGADASFDLAEPALRVMGSKLVRVGTVPGQGATAKAINQLLCGAHLAIAAEGMALAERLGVDTQVMLDILSGSAASSWMLRDRGPRMTQDDPVVTSAVDIFVKDLGIVMEAGREAKAALPMAALAHQMFLSVSGQGFGALDDSQVIRAYRSLQGRV